MPTIGERVVGFEIRFIDRDGVIDGDGIPKSIIDPPNSCPPTLRRGDTELSRRMLKRSLLFEIRLSLLPDEMLLFLDIFGVETLLFLLGIREGMTAEPPLPPSPPPPPPLTTPNRPL